METLAAIVRDGNVENVVVYDENADWAPPEGTDLLVLSQGENVGIGWTRVDNAWVAPPVPDPIPEE